MVIGESLAHASHYAETTVSAIFVLTWFPLMVDTFLVDRTETFAWLDWVHVILIPAQGLFNALVYSGH